jgi:hypothetical protein
VISVNLCGLSAAGGSTMTAPHSGVMRSCQVSVTVLERSKAAMP